MKMMRYRIFIFLLAFVFVSCEDFLDIEQQAVFQDDNYFRNQETATEAIIACYDIFQAQWPIHWADVFVIPSDTRSDDVVPGGNPSPNEDEINRNLINDYVITADNPLISDMWEFYFAGVWRSNVAIEKINQIPDSEFSPGAKNRLIAEARYLRAFHYSFLVKIYGDLPLVDRTLSPPEYNQPRVDKSIIFDLIKRDTRFAITHLNLKANTQKGRATKGAAIHLLANILMYEAGTDASSANWQQVYNLTDTLVNGPYSNEYTLLDDFSDIWEEGQDFNEETIFEINFHDNLQIESASFVYWLSPRFVKDSNGEPLGANGWGNNCPTQDLVDAFETNLDWNDPNEWEDPRLSASVWREGDIVPTGANDANNVNDPKEVYLDFSPTGYYMKKYMWLNEPENFNGPINPKVFRFADVILMHAEAAYYLGDEGQARESLNKIRERARHGNNNILPDITASGQQLIEAIWHERRVELALESHRFFDLARTGRLVNTMQSKGKSFVENKHELLPIPAEELALNPEMTQNPNY